MGTIYLDMDQCARFRVDYFDKEATLAVAADAVLRTKPQGYDEKHRDLLEPLGGATLSLEACPSEGPGWFTITEVLR